MAVEAALPVSTANVTGAIRRASQLTGTSFQYLLATAQVESSFNPNAQAARSSARGLFQFIEQTWLATLKASGAALGYGQYANAIEKMPSGRHTVSDPDLRREILALRQDPAANALMAGAFTQSNAAKLAARIGRDPTDGELYMAHFLGPSGAAKLIDAATATPQASAAEMFPQAARANPSIFFSRSGEARSLAQVSQVLSGKYEMARTVPAPSEKPATLAQVTTAAPAVPFAWANLRTPAAPAQALSPATIAPVATLSERMALAPEMPRTTSSIPSAGAIAPRPAKTADSLGHRLLLFASTLAGAMPTAAESPDAIRPAQSILSAADEPVRTMSYAGSDERSRSFVPTDRSARSTARAASRNDLSDGYRDAVAPLVRELWKAPVAQTGLRPGAVSMPTGRGLQDLFQDAPARVRALFAGA